ncbi:terminase B [Parablautia sp. Marseille-Q6255]|uniref:terminase B n=1 Tax=Parablautia sp. Marseille-Q6255 TaxID=3039593 RepID=UPI0024BC5829|nr:terminase B [Parablautia sp. Marseille-Q6255]
MNDLDWLSDFLDESIPIWRVSPPTFFREVLNFEPDTWQEEASMDLTVRSKIAIKSGQGVGKTAFEAATFLWFLICFYNARIVCTAPTKQQLNDVLWSEVAKWMSASPLLDILLKWTKTYVYVRGYEKRWFAVARTATKPENMQGFHEDNMLFIVDEASGVADSIMEAILGTLSGANNKLLMCGNPTRTSGAFYDAFHADANLYAFRTVSSRDSKRTNKDNIQSLIRKYGEKSNVVRVRVDGEFPMQEDDVFLQLDWIMGSIQTEMTDQTAKAFGCYQNDSGQQVHDVSSVQRIEIGCDVARFGDDKTCIGYRVNEVARYYKKYHGQDTTATAGHISALYLMLKKKFQWKGRIPVKVDDGGVGGGTVDQLRAMKRAQPDIYATMDIVPVHFGVPIRRHLYYYDTTTYMMGVLRDMIQPFDEAGNPRLPELILPDDVDLIAQLSCRKYSFVTGGRQKVESKKEMKERGLPSPDEADCMLLVCLPVKTRNERR